MARNSLLRGLAFALVAGTTAPFLVFAAGLPVASVALCTVVVHLLVVAPNLRRGLHAAALASALALPCALFVSDQLTGIALGAVILGLCRSALLYPRSFARALVAELAFLGVGSVSALIWAGTAFVGVPLMTWSFWLVQAGFVLFQPDSRGSGDVPADPFERAQRLAEAVLAGRPH
ncbi:MAG TPA: hypothetical protein VFQ35_28070 [Polyangiaceae bacterium]|nr:hypothetical protein [Polyangiaceae bacterium]